MKNIFYTIVISVTLFSCILNAQWVKQTFPSLTPPIIFIDFINQNHGVALTAKDISLGPVLILHQPEAFYTKDAGINWISATLPDSFMYMTGVQLINENIGYASANFQQGYQATGLFAETTDGGMSWHRKGSLGYEALDVESMRFKDVNNGFAEIATENGRILKKTTDGGKTWNLNYNLGIDSYIEDIKFADSLNGIAVGENRADSTSVGFILTTNDGGENWNSQLLPQFNNILNSAFLNSNTLIISVVLLPVKSAIYKSTDSGKTWFEFHSYDDLYKITGVAVAPNTTTIISYGGYGILYTFKTFIDISLDSGNLWDNKVFDYTYFTSVKFIDQNKCYLSGADSSGQGIILFNNDISGINAINEEHTNIPSNFELKQNYPNPFNPSTTLSFVIGHSSFVSLKVYDLLGREVATLVNETKTPGNYEVNFNAPNLPSGIYLYKLQAGSLTESKKMILLK